MFACILVKPSAVAACKRSFAPSPGVEMNNCTAACSVNPLAQPLAGDNVEQITRNESFPSLGKVRHLLLTVKLLSSLGQNKCSCYLWSWVIKIVFSHLLCTNRPLTPPRSHSLMKCCSPVLGSKCVASEVISLVSTGAFHTWINNICRVLLFSAFSSLFWHFSNKSFPTPVHLGLVFLHGFNLCRAVDIALRYLVSCHS